MKNYLSLTVVAVALMVFSSCQTSTVIAKSNTKASGKDYPLQLTFEVKEHSFYALVTDINHPADYIDGEGYFLNIEGDKVTADLPHFMLRNVFTDVYEKPNLQLEDHTLESVAYQRYEDPREFTLRFNVWKNAERWQFELHVMPDGTAFMKVYSAQRPMTAGYSGKIRSS